MIHQVIKCDECQAAITSPAGSWSLEYGMEGRIVVKIFDPFTKHHFCGPDCLMKAMSRWMEEQTSHDRYDRDASEAVFQEDRRQALASGSYEVFLQHKAQYPGVYNFSGPWADDPQPPSAV